MDFAESFERHVSPNYSSMLTGLSARVMVADITQWYTMIIKRYLRHPGYKQVV